jgi:hypothetical protein
MEDGGRLAPMAVELVDRLACWRQFVASLAWVLLTLALCALKAMSVCRISFVELLMFLFDVFGGMSDVNSCNGFFAARHGTLGSYLRDALHGGSGNAVACLLVLRA